MSISLISYHEKVIHLNSLISYHEYVNITYQSCNFKNLLVSNKISYKLTGSRMYKLSKTSKRPREGEEPARPIPTIDHSRRVLERACPMCSDSQGTIRHHHYSSTEIRRMFLDQGTQTTFPCHICHDLEPVVVPPMEVRRIVLSDC